MVCKNVLLEIYGCNTCCATHYRKGSKLVFHKEKTLQNFVQGAPFLVLVGHHCLSTHISFHISNLKSYASILKITIMKHFQLV